MDLIDSTYILRNILDSELPKTPSAVYWTKKLAQASALDETRSVKLAKEIRRVLASRPFVLLTSRASVSIYTLAQLSKMGVEKLSVKGFFQYYATAKVPDRLLFLKKKKTSGKPDEDAARIIDIRTTWLAIEPYEIRFITTIEKGGIPNPRLVLRASAWLEHLRLATEKDILRIGNEEAWKKASKKERAKLDYCSIAAFDRILIIGLLRKNFLRLTPRAEYYFNRQDGHVSKATPKYLHHLIFSISRQNRYRFFPKK